MNGPKKVAAEVWVSHETLAEAEAHQALLDAIAAAERQRTAIAAKVAAYPNPPKKPTRRERRLAARREAET